MCIVIYKCVKYILKIKEVMLIFFVIDFVFFLNFEVFLCLLYNNGWMYIICKKKIIWILIMNMKKVLKI